MAYIVFLLGLMLTGCGGYVLYLGFDDLTTERGLALTMSGTVAFSVGIAVLSIGFGVLALGRLARMLSKITQLASVSSSDGGRAAAALPAEAAIVGMAMPETVRSDAAALGMRARPSIDDPMMSAVEDAIFSAGSSPELVRPTLPRSEPVEAHVETEQAPARGRLSLRGAAVGAAAVAGTAAAADAMMRGNGHDRESHDREPADGARSDTAISQPEIGGHDSLDDALNDAMRDLERKAEQGRLSDASHAEPTALTGPLAGPLAEPEDVPDEGEAAPLSETHAEIDRLIEELSADHAEARAPSTLQTPHPAKAEHSPTELDVDRKSAFEAALRDEMIAIDAVEHEPASEGHHEGAHQGSEADSGDQPTDLIHLEPVRDAKPPSTSAEDDDWLFSAEPSAPRHLPEAHLSDHDADPDVAHLEPVATDEESTSLRESTHQAALDEPSEIIGSYESAGVTYTLHADGSVVAEAGSKRETYPSLEALRGAFERGESIFSV